MVWASQSHSTGRHSQQSLCWLDIEHAEVLRASGLKQYVLVSAFAAHEMVLSVFTDAVNVMEAVNPSAPASPLLL